MAFVSSSLRKISLASPEETSEELTFFGTSDDFHFLYMKLLRKHYILLGTISQALPSVYHTVHGCRNPRTLRVGIRDWGDLDIDNCGRGVKNDVHTVRDRFKVWSSM
jgi:hypothetical protein